MLCFFASDLHGKEDRYIKLFIRVKQKMPAAVFLGGDLLPHSYGGTSDFIHDFLRGETKKLKTDMGTDYPAFFIILGNDDPKVTEKDFLRYDNELWYYSHSRKLDFEGFKIIGYSYVPPSPFRLKDWEKYDVSRFTDPGCIPPENGIHTVSTDLKKLQWETIAKDINKLSKNIDMRKSVWLFHSPPYQTKLDRADLDGKSVDHAPLDVHVGSIAVKRLIEKKQPLITMHGHIHESTRLTGEWKERIGKTYSFQAAHDKSELSLIEFNLHHPENSTRFLI